MNIDYIHARTKVTVQVGNKHNIFDPEYISQFCIKLIDQGQF